jgi:hypothetical protein
MTKPNSVDAASMHPIVIVRLDKSGRDVTELSGLWDESDRIYEFTGNPIWPQEYVDAFNRQQNDTSLHPMTCGNDSWHEILQATRFGLVCLECDYRQSWAHPLFGSSR